jgi:hypothetical protein
VANNLGVRWELATPLGISVNADVDAWNSGHVTDVLPLDDGAAGLVVATHTGGVWLVTSGGTTALSDRWDCPDIQCLALGPDNARHVYAGTAHGQIYETTAGAVAPLLEWKPIDRPLPDDAGSVQRILVLPRHRRLVALCSGGVFWSRTSGSLWAGPKWPGRHRARYVWYRATGVGGCYDGAVAAVRDIERPGQDDLEYVTIVAGASSGGIWVGGWTGDDLQFERTLDLPTAAASSVAASDLRAARVYAATSLGDGTFGGFWRSDDGGLNWSLVLAMDRDGTQLRNLAGGQGDQWNNCVTVMPDRPEVVVLGWHDTFATADEGRTWTALSVADHLHSDVHALRFAANGLNPGMALYIGSDGGVAEVDGEGLARLAADGAGQPGVRSELNRNLPTLQLYATSNAPDRIFAGNLAVSTQGDTFVLAGSQDNGSVFARADGGAPWLRVAGGDGSASGTWGDDLFNNLIFGPLDVQHQVRDPATDRFTPPTAVPIDAGGSLTPQLIEPVRRPAYRNGNGDLMVQIAGAAASATQQSGVFGLFASTAVRGSFYWQWLGDLPGSPTISAVASVTGHMVWVGTSGARIFSLDSSGKTAPVETPVPPPTKASPFQPAPTGIWVMRIATIRDGRAYAIVSAVYANENPASYVIRLDGLQWVKCGWAPSLGSHKADGLAYGLEVVPQQRADPVFVSTDRDVFASVDDGLTWQQVTDGLPARVHGADLRFGYRRRPPAGGTWLYLATFGRSLWRASMDHLDLP